MADLLYPIQRLGAAHGVTVPGDLLLYAVRDKRGVEPPAADPGDRSGFNEEALWTQRAEAAATADHDPQTLNHVSPKFPAAFVRVISIWDEGSQTFSLEIDGSSRVGNVRHDKVPIGPITMKTLDPADGFTIDFNASLNEGPVVFLNSRALALCVWNGSQLDVTGYRMDPEGRSMTYPVIFYIYSE